LPLLEGGIGFRILALQQHFLDFLENPLVEERLHILVGFERRNRPFEVCLDLLMGAQEHFRRLVRVRAPPFVVLSDRIGIAAVIRLRLKEIEEHDQLLLGRVFRRVLGDVDALELAVGVLVFLDKALRRLALQLRCLRHVALQEARIGRVRD
jgi:hypothetical protein